jgi:uncharacterized protein YerC
MFFCSSQSVSQREKIVAFFSELLVVVEIKTIKERKTE